MGGVIQMLDKKTGYAMIIGGKGYVELRHAKRDDRTTKQEVGDLDL